MLAAVAQRTIQRLPASVSADEMKHVIASETPVILEGVPIDTDFGARIQERDFLDRIESNEQVEHGRATTRHSKVWLDVTPTGARQDPVMSELYDELNRIVPTEGVSVRDTNVRLWGSPQGTITTWHYDGNGIHGLNLQVAGRKFWQLVSPDTPLPAFPFTRLNPQGACPLTARQREELDWMEFETGPGDLLFLPRLWSHFVLSLDEWNANLNLVFTPLSAATSKLARREYARVAAVSTIHATRLGRLLPATLSSDAVGYGGGVADHFRLQVAPKDVRKVALEEMRLVPLMTAVTCYRRVLGYT